ncbi:hypothetical protein J6TS2_26360 [Heyndrickxia sporothermodurans]|nr:hypothetical protein J6TS2_26360 [Heyndrickxia sporothermodurans]
MDESLRGKGCGKKLLDLAEEAAKKNHCRHIQLDTFSFQAPTSYQKYGYQVVGMIDDHPCENFQQFFLKKKLQ